MRAYNLESHSPHDTLLGELSLLYGGGATLQVVGTLTPLKNSVLVPSKVVPV